MSTDARNQDAMALWFAQNYVSAQVGFCYHGAYFASKGAMYMAGQKIGPGLRGEKQTLVCEHNVAGHVNKFSTPDMIRLMEQASMAAISHLLEADEVSVGFEVNVRHLAPADLGATIKAKAELTEVDRNRLMFTVEAYDGDRKIGEGSHRRTVISTDR